MNCPKIKQAGLIHIPLLGILTVIIVTGFFLLSKNTLRQSNNTSTESQESSTGVKKGDSNPAIRRSFQENNQRKNLSEIPGFDNPLEIRFIEEKDIEFFSPELIKAIHTDRPEEYQSKFYKVGKIKSGEYKDYDLIRADIILHYGGPCKPPARCFRPVIVRYLKSGNNLILIPQIRDFQRYENMDGFIEEYGTLNVDDWKFSVDKGLIIKPLQIVEDFEMKTGNIKYIRTELGEKNDNVYLLFGNPLIGNIYTTKSEFIINNPTYDENKVEELKKNIPGLGESWNFEFTDNAFYKFNEDGTYYVYNFLPRSFDEEITDRKHSIYREISLNDNFYYFVSRYNCTSSGLDKLSITENITENELIKLERLSKPEREIFFFKEKDHQFLKDFYETYKSNIYKEGYPRNTAGGQYEKKDILSYDEFVEILPVLFLKDDFGRLIRLTHFDMAPGYFCEPIIYLYPEVTQKISVKIANSVTLWETMPEYKNNWNVKATPQSEITIEDDDNVYEYLFWEGTSGILPKRNDGFVISKENVATELPKILQKLGLNEKETEDFMEAWYPYVSEAPYYFITFHSQEVIDEYAELFVSPKPDTVIRVLMVYEPLNTYKEVPEFIYEPVPERKGFTLIEWGGILR